MAGVSLSVLQPNGVTATYWKVGRMQINNVALVADVYGYLDQTSYNNGCSPVASLTENFDATAFDTILASSDIITAFYTALLDTADFSGGTLV